MKSPPRSSTIAGHLGISGPLIRHGKPLLLGGFFYCPLQGMYRLLISREAIEYKTAGSLIDEFVLNRRLLIEAISGIDSNAKFTIGSGKRQFTVDKYLKIFIDHDIHHLKQMNERIS